MRKDTKEATLQIGSFSSRCSACDGVADPRESYHTNVQMQAKGCGAKYTKVTYYGSFYNEEKTAMRQTVMEMRPDLPYFE